jgi:hypothetical protein
MEKNWTVLLVNSLNRNMIDDVLTEGTIEDCLCWLINGPKSYTISGVGTHGGFLYVKENA